MNSGAGISETGAYFFVDYIFFDINGSILLKNLQKIQREANFVNCEYYHVSHFYETSFNLKENCESGHSKDQPSWTANVGYFRILKFYKFSVIKFLKRLNFQTWLTENSMSRQRLLS